MYGHALLVSNFRYEMNERNQLDPGLCDWLEGVMDRHGGRSLIIGLGGPGGCGKSTLAERLAARYPKLGVLSLDNYRLPRGERSADARYGSHPEANDLARLRSDLEDFRKTGQCTHPVYDLETGARAPERTIQGVSVLLAEGDLAAYNLLADCWDFLILMRVSRWTQLKVRLTRDWRQRKNPLSKVLHVFWTSNLRHYPRYSRGARERADWLVENAATTVVDR